MTPRTRMSPLIVAVLLVSGCGGDETAKRRQGENRARTTDDRVTKREFTQAANRLCAKIERRSAEITRRRPRNPDQVVGNTRRLVNFSRDSLRGFEELPLPSEAQARAGAERYLRLLRRVNEPLGRAESSADALEEALDREDEQAGRAAALALKDAGSDVERAGRQSDPIARAYGLKDCAD